MLCEYYYEPGSSQTQRGLNLLSGICILPHHDTFGKSWATRLTTLLPQTTLIGIDEQTAVICCASEGLGRIWGKGQMTIYKKGRSETHGPDMAFDLSLLGISNLPLLR